MRKLIFIRHSAVSKDPNISPHDWPLSEDGRSRTHALLPRLTPVSEAPPTRFITSHEPKAMETGQILADALDKPCTTAPGLQEHDRLGTPYYANQAEFENIISRLFTQPTELVFGNETADQARTRFTQAIHTLLAQHPTDTLAIVTHGTVLTLFLAHHNPQLDPIPFWRNLQLPDLVIVSLPDMKILERAGT
jgi:broad specificity phosphatase PhoE